MDRLSLTLILLAAFVHVIPHVLLKGVEERGVHPLPYIYLVLFVNLLIYTRFMRIATIRATWNAARWRIVMAAATAPIAYALVLTAMRAARWQFTRARFAR